MSSDRKLFGSSRDIGKRDGDIGKSGSSSDSTNISPLRTPDAFQPSERGRGRTRPGERSALRREYTAPELSSSDPRPPDRPNALRKSNTEPGLSTAPGLYLGKALPAHMSRSRRTEVSSADIAFMKSMDKTLMSQRESGNLMGRMSAEPESFRPSDVPSSQARGQGSAPEAVASSPEAAPGKKLSAKKSLSKMADYIKPRSKSRAREEVLPPPSGFREIDRTGGIGESPNPALERQQRLRAQRSASSLRPTKPWEMGDVPPVPTRGESLPFIDQRPTTSEREPRPDQTATTSRSSTKDRLLRTARSLPRLGDLVRSSDRSRPPLPTELNESPDDRAIRVSENHTDLFLKAWDKLEADYNKAKEKKPKSIPRDPSELKRMTHNMRDEPGRTVALKIVELDKEMVTKIRKSGINLPPYLLVTEKDLARIGKKTETPEVQKMGNTKKDWRKGW